MEADWSVEVGADLPRIAVPWSEYSVDTIAGPQGGLHFVDLRSDPAAIDRLKEPRRLPGLKRALLALNLPGSPVFTSKCDVFPITKDEIDPAEFDADGECDAGLSCYIDLVMHDSAIFASFGAHESWLRGVVEELRKHAQVRSARVDFVLRPAMAFAREGFAVTLYIAACGADPAAAQQTWGAALDAVLRALRSRRGPAAAPRPE